MSDEQITCNNCGSQLDNKDQTFECQGCALEVCEDCTDDRLCGGCQDAKEIDEQ